MQPGLRGATLVLSAGAPEIDELLDRFAVLVGVRLHRVDGRRASRRDPRAGARIVGTAHFAIPVEVHAARTLRSVSSAFVEPSELVDLVGQDPADPGPVVLGVDLGFAFHLHSGRACEVVRVGGGRSATSGPHALCSRRCSAAHGRTAGSGSGFGRCLGIGGLDAATADGQGRAKGKKSRSIVVHHGVEQCRRHATAPSPRFGPRPSTRGDASSVRSRRGVNSRRYGAAGDATWSQRGRLGRSEGRKLSCTEVEHRRGADIGGPWRNARRRRRRQIVCSIARRSGKMRRCRSASSRGSSEGRC